jgi:cellulose synthase/poly-beta-1,6-N-acetylglucosamine synthase-like glycosyltransferase
MRSIREVTTDIIWRCDDDAIPESTCLERLLAEMKDGVGAVGGCVFFGPPEPMPDIPKNDIKLIYTHPNAQWFKSTEIVEVDHLYSTYIFRREAANPDYGIGLSPKGHREETIATFDMKKRGWKIIFNPHAITWHIRQPTGGIRA